MEWESFFFKAWAVSLCVILNTISLVTSSKFSYDTIGSGFNASS
jgi:hypothetical protein